MLAHTLLPNSRLLHLRDVVISPVEITLIVSTVSPEAACPVCGTPSSRVHSRYVRTLTDLPCAQRSVRIRVHTRRFFCDQPDCQRVIFTERLGDVARPYGRRTLRLADTLHAIAYALGGRPGARMVAHLRIPASADTLLRHVAQRRASASETPRVLGVDDWALRTGRRYGTILVDLERARVVDLLPDRRAESLAQWLTEHPGVELIVRDRAGAYADGAKEGAPEAKQVADRWHLLKNLTDALEAIVTRETPAVHQAAAPPGDPRPDSPHRHKEGVPPPPPPSSLRREQERQARQERKRAIFEEVKRLSRLGHTLLAIARQTGKDPHTVRTYVRTDGFPQPKRRRRRPGQLAPFEAYLARRWQEGCRNATQLWREIQDQGFQGGVTSVRERVSAWRTRHPSGDPPTNRGGLRVPAPRTVVWWLLGSQQKRTAEQVAFLERLKQRSPTIARAQALALDFFALVQRREGDPLAGWMERAMASGIDELQRFCAGLRRDEEAVTAGLTLPWSNGPVEGQINRLKGIKRQMFGRAGWMLLRARVLPLATGA